MCPPPIFVITSVRAPNLSSARFLKKSSSGQTLVKPKLEKTGTRESKGSGREVEEPLKRRRRGLSCCGGFQTTRDEEVDHSEGCLSRRKSTRPS